MTTGRRKLLLADDSLTIQKVVSLTFMDEGLDVITVSDGEQALSEIERNVPDIVLADVFMPKVNGYEVCARLKADERFRHIPVMLLVGTFEPFNEAEARKVGADDVLTKPFQSIRNLVNKVGGLLGGQTEQEADSEDLSLTGATTSRTSTGDSADDFAAQKRKGTDDEEMGQDKMRGTREAAAAEDEHSAAYADISMDDQLIEATSPGEAAGDETSSPSEAGDQIATPDRSTGASFGEAGGAGWETDDHSPPPPSSHQSLTLPGARSDEPAQGTGPAFAVRMAGAAAADDALLDLGEIESPRGSAEADDFILDLADDSPSAQLTSESSGRAAQKGATALGDVTTGGEAAGDDNQTPGTAAAAAPPDFAGAFAEAAHGEPGGSSSAAAAPSAFSLHAIRPEEKVSEELFSSEARGWAPAAEEEDIAVPSSSDMERRPVSAARGAEAVNPEAFYGAVDATSYRGDDSSSSAAGSAADVGMQEIRLEHLAPEVIDAIARRAVEHLSERVVQEIAWEVVPQLAELLIRRRLDEEKSRTP